MVAMYVASRPGAAYGTGYSVYLPLQLRSEGNREIARGVSHNAILGEAAAISLASQHEVNGELKSIGIMQHVGPTARLDLDRVKLPRPAVSVNLVRSANQASRLATKGHRFAQPEVGRHEGRLAPCGHQGDRGPKRQNDREYKGVCGICAHGGRAVARATGSG